MLCCVLAWILCISLFLIDPLIAKEWNNGVLWARGLWTILSVTGSACIIGHWFFTMLFWNQRARKLSQKIPPASGYNKSPRWMCWAFAFIYIPIFSVFTPLMAVLSVENIYGSYKWNQVRAQLEQRGEKLRWNEWASQIVPDEENFAKHPIFSMMQEKVSDSKGISTAKWIPTPEAATLLRTLNLPDKFARQHHLANHPDSRSNPSMESWALAFKQAISNQPPPSNPTSKTAAELPNYPQAPTGASNLEIVGTAISVADDLLNEIDVASHLPHFRLSSMGKSPDFDIPFQKLSVMRKIANFLNFRSRYFLEVNKPEKAAHDILLMLRMADQLEDEPLLITHLIRISLVAIAINNFEAGIPKHQWTKSELMTLNHAFTQSEFLATAKTCIQRERAMASEMFHQWIQGKGGLLGADQFLPNGSRGTTSWMPGWIRQTQAAYILILQDWLDITTPHLTKPTTLHGVNLLASIDPDQTMRQYSFNPHYNFANLVLPSIHKIYAKSLRIQQLCIHITTACALERYYLEHQTYPPTLHALAPEYTPEVPVDIMDRSELKYEHTEEGGFRLWSIGLDGKNDGGDSKKDRDWVWPRSS